MGIGGYVPPLLESLGEALEIFALFWVLECPLHPVVLDFLGRSYEVEHVDGILLGGHIGGFSKLR